MTSTEVQTNEKHKHVFPVVPQIPRHHRSELLTEGIHFNLIHLETDQVLTVCGSRDVISVVHFLTG